MAIKYPGSIMAGLQLMGADISKKSVKRKTRKLKIVASPEWKKEQEKYVWNEKTGKPIDKHNHLWDALRYWFLWAYGEDFV